MRLKYEVMTVNAFRARWIQVAWMRKLTTPLAPTAMVRVTVHHVCGAAYATAVEVL